MELASRAIAGLYIHVFNPHNSFRGGFYYYSCFAVEEVVAVPTSPWRAKSKASSGSSGSTISDLSSARLLVTAVTV